MKNKASILVAGGLMALAPLAHAEFSLSGNVALTTDYVYRGISQTDEDPAIQGGFDLEHSSGFYAGIWGSNVDFNDGDEAHIEIDVYLGVSGEFANKLGWDVGFIHYDYPGAASSLDYDFDEIYGSLSYDFGPAALSGGVAYSSDFFGGIGDATYYNLDLDIPLPSDFGLGLHWGHQDFHDTSGDYDDYKVSLSKSFGGFDFALDYTDTDLSTSECGGTDLCDSRFLLSVSKSL